MKIIVDKIPDMASCCLFSEYSGDGTYYCKLDQERCPVEYYRSCDKLIPAEGLYVSVIQNSGGCVYTSYPKVQIEGDYE